MLRDARSLRTRSRRRSPPYSGETWSSTTTPLTSVSATTITGTLDTLAANATYPVRLEFFANTTCDSSNHGEGEIFLGTITHAAPGAFTFNYTSVTG